MAKNQMSRKEQLAKSIGKSHAHWIRLRENGGNDPFWPDGVNLNLLMNHIIYDRRLCEEELQEEDYPDEYYISLPEEMPPNFMVKSKEIREQAFRLLHRIKENPDYMELVGRSEKGQKTTTMIRSVSGDSQSILDDDLVAMRRFIHWDFGEMVKQAKEELKEMMPVIKNEKPLPEGQLSIFDLFDVYSTGGTGYETYKKR